MTEGHGNCLSMTLALTLGLCLGIAGPAGADQWGSGSGGGNWVASWAASPQQPIDPVVGGVNIPSPVRHDGARDRAAQHRRLPHPAAPDQ